MAANLNFKWNNDSPIQVQKALITSDKLTKVLTITNL